MLCSIYDAQGRISTLLEGLTPICGEDYCESCGDCLACSEWDCYDSGGCWWTEDEENVTLDWLWKRIGDSHRWANSLPSKTARLPGSACAFLKGGEAR